LNNEVSGIRVCDEIVAMYQGKDREEGETLAVTISTQVARELTPYTDGLYLITPFRRVELMGRILKEIEGI
jgi:homocysteine S-methyltransferase